MENRELLHLPQAGRCFPAKITALSPSDITKRLALEKIARSLPKPGDTQIRLVSRNENDASVALWIEAGPLRALLGADLEQTGHAGAGWTAVLSCHQGHRPDQLAAFLKVPHHGSKNADVPEVWARMLRDNPIAVLTPFTPAGLPQKSDLRRLAARTNHLYITALGTGRPPSRDPSVEKMMKQVVTERQVVAGRTGHVRVRWPIYRNGSTPTVETFNGAERFPAVTPRSRH
jgi:hypothetical protein